MSFLVQGVIFRWTSREKFRGEVNLNGSAFLGRIPLLFTTFLSDLGVTFWVGSNRRTWWKISSQITKGSMKIENFRDFFTTPRHKCFSCSFFKKTSWKMKKYTSMYVYMYVYTYIYIYVYIYVHTTTSYLHGLKRTMMSYCHDASFLPL